MKRKMRKYAYKAPFHSKFVVFKMREYHNILCLIK